MKIQHSDNGKEGEFYIVKEGHILAKMEYDWSGTDRILITHTHVSDALRGQGAGKQLVTKAVEFAREKGIKIVPLCPFAKSVFDKVDKFRDVL